MEWAGCCIGNFVGVASMYAPSETRQQIIVELRKRSASLNCSCGGGISKVCPCLLPVWRPKDRCKTFDGLQAKGI